MTNVLSEFLEEGKELKVTNEDGFKWYTTNVTKEYSTDDNIVCLVEHEEKKIKTYVIINRQGEILYENESITAIYDRMQVHNLVKEFMM